LVYYASQIDRKVKDCNPCARSTTNDTDAANTDATAMTIAIMSKQVHILYHLPGIPRNDKWKVFLEHMMDNNVTLTTTPGEIVSKPVDKEAATNTENGLAPEVMLFAMQGGNSCNGGNGGKAGRGGKSPRRDNRNTKDNRKEKDRRECFHRQQQGHIIENCLSKQYSEPPTSADIAAEASTEELATWTVTTFIEN
jgi:hypothetical protein